jgi:peptidoglycan/xylan/chitin deacetylase (PgdA/CDA1 family)
VLRETRQRRGVTIVLYHDPDRRLFDQHVRALARRYTIIPLRHLGDALAAGTFAALPSKALVITLDDGHRGNRALLPVLERHRTPVTIFLCADIVGSDRRFWFLHVRDPESFKTLPNAERLARLAATGYEDRGEPREALSHDELAEMRGGLVDFGSHGLTHPILTACDPDTARREIVESRERLAQRFGVLADAFSYPNGDHGSREVAFTRQAGYRLALTVLPGTNRLTTDPFRLRRIAIDDADSVAAALVKASGLWAWVLDAIHTLTRWRTTRPAVLR